MSRLDELLQQRAEIDAELATLKAEAEQEIAQANARLQALNAALGKPIAVTPPRPVRDATPLDETDAGNGVREVDSNQSAADFNDELAELRTRSQAKRAARR